MDELLGFCDGRECASMAFAASAAINTVPNFTLKTFETVATITQPRMRLRPPHAALRNAACSATKQSRH